VIKSYLALKAQVSRWVACFDCDKRSRLPMFTSHLELADYMANNFRYVPDPAGGALDFYTHPERTQYEIEAHSHAWPCDCDDYAVYAYQALTQMPGYTPQILTLVDAGIKWSHVICLFHHGPEVWILDTNGLNSYIGALGGILSVGTSNVSGSEKLQVSGNAYVSGAITAASINVGEDTLDVYDEGSFTISASNVAMFDTLRSIENVSYTRVGKNVTLRFPSGSWPAGSNTALDYNAVNGTIPAALRPAAAFFFPCPVINNTVKAIGKCKIDTSGVLTVYPDAVESAWSTSGTKGSEAMVVSYPLN